MSSEAAAIEVIPPVITYPRIALDLLIQGGAAVLFRLTTPITKILDSIYLSSINALKPGALAASGLTSTLQQFLTHSLGAFVNTLPIKFKLAMEDPEGSTADLYFAAHINAFLGSWLFMLPMFWSKEMFINLFKQSPVLSQYGQNFFDGLVYGFHAIQFFSVNRQYLYSECGKKFTPIKYLLPVIGALEALMFGLLGYGLICGQWGAPFLANYGSGITTAASAWLGFILSTGLIVFTPTLRAHIWKKPNLTKIARYMRELFVDGLPVSARYVLENLSLLGFSLLAGSINQNNLTALQICWTLMQLQTAPCFSFVSGTKGSLKHNDKTLQQKTALTVMTLTASYATLCLLILIFAGQDLTRLLSNGHSLADQDQIAKLTQTALPLLASSEIANAVFHTERAVLQNAGERHKTTAETWTITGNTFVFQCALFLPLAYVFGKLLDYDVPGMSAVYLSSMLAVALALAPRVGNYLRHPEKKLTRSWASFFCGSRSPAPEEQQHLLNRHEPKLN